MMKPLKEWLIFAAILTVCFFGLLLGVVGTSGGSVEHLALLGGMTLLAGTVLFVSFVVAFLRGIWAMDQAAAADLSADANEAPSDTPK